MNTILKGLALGFSLFAYSAAHAQTGDESYLAKSLNSYNKRTMQEKIFLHSDRESYLAGESMWFKVYNVEGNSHQSAKLSKIAYVEVLDQEQNPVMQAKVALTDGSGNGSFLLPATLNSGNYLVRAYTNWMKNFSADLYFEKPITIVNTFKQLGLQQEAASAAFDVNFFPEGGHLVNGVQSVVAFKTTDATGKSIPFDGLLLNQANDTLTKFSTHQFGIGRFTFTPEAGQKYRTVLRGPEGQIITRELPHAQDRGFVLNLSNVDTDLLKISVRTNPLALAPGAYTVYLLAHTRKEAALAYAAHPNEAGEIIFTIPKDKLGEGITYFTVFNANKQPVCERLYFKKPQQLLQLSAQTDQKKYSTRSEVNLDIKTTLMGAARPANLSVAVYRMDSLQRWQQQSMASYLWLSSELKGAIEQPEYYLTQTGTAAELAQDNLMLTHGWSKFNWKEVLHDTTATPYTHATEYGGHLVRARVFNAKTKKPAAGVQAYLASPSRDVKLSTAVSDSAGNLLFDMMRLYGSRTLVLQANTTNDSSYTFEIESPFFALKSSYKLPRFQLSESHEPTLLASSIHMQVQNYHTAGVAYKYTLPAYDSTAFYGTPDKSYFLDTYTRFPVMEEVMREYVQPVFVRRRQGKFHFFVVNQPVKALFDQEPMILLDGVPVFETDKIMAFDPRKVQRLDVVSRKYFHGSATFNGVVSYVTYAGDLAGYEVDPKALLQEYEGMQLAREFYSPQYTTSEQRSSRIPDLRNLLYWNPDATTSGQSNLNFFTSDQTGTYQVVVHGLSKEGNAGTGTYTFKVE
ncbi:hypothetical protein [uncultured Pontibacter sp.]|uniref:hypothetical protein n=1 Tax=uncultured Pontibacter sp. TaxID=453356 RepID=UPI002626484D|nr:hypothetical protein [uncultured Pontibacter sp.]